MTAHIHAAMVAEYAKDAFETETPWDRWQFKWSDSNEWNDASAELAFSPKLNYRRKPVPLCQIEGRDVFPGDRLWSLIENVYIVAHSMKAKHLRADSTQLYTVERLSWTEPAKTKTVYQWAFEQPDGRFCATSYFYATEAEARIKGVAADHRKVLRLDYTALEVPA